MLFNSFTFMIFLPVVFLLYWFVFKKLKWQNLLILVASYIFYGWWDWRFVILIFITSLSSFISGLAIKHYEGNRKAQKAVSAANIILNLGILAVFKYFNFFIESLDVLLKAMGITMDWPTMNIILPVGISFYTLQALSYSIDVYSRKIEPTRDTIAFFSYISFFPQLVAGPIELATNLLPQMLNKRTFNYATAVDGMRQMLWGFFKKLVIADTCAEVVNQIWSDIPGSTGLTLFICAVIFSFQIYADFSGYSDIAIGCAKLFGIRLTTNFKVPFFSRNAQEFWRRWHITLMAWFMNYVYFPLGGSRCSKRRKIFNTLTVFVLSGMWHGANWTFVLWGLYYGLVLVLANELSTHRYKDTVAAGRRLPTFKELRNMTITYLSVIYGMVIFRSPDVSQFFAYSRRLFSLSLFNHHGLTMKMATTLLWCATFVIIEWIQRDKEHVLQIDGYRVFSTQGARLALYALILCLLFYFAGQVQTFIYFQF